MVLSANIPNPINVPADNHINDFSSSTFLSTRSYVSYYPKENEHASMFKKVNNHEGNDPSSGPGVWSYLEDNNNSARIFVEINNPEGNEPEQHSSLNKEPSAIKELSTIFCSNKLTLLYFHVWFVSLSICYHN